MSGYCSAAAPAGDPSSASSLPDANRKRTEPKVLPPYPGRFCHPADRASRQLRGYQKWDAFCEAVHNVMTNTLLPPDSKGVMVALQISRKS